MWRYLALWGILLHQLFINLALADSHLDVLYDRLKDTGINYKVIGAVCEQVAKIKFEEHFPTDSFEIITGISYLSQGQVLGELDLVVTDKHDHRVIAVAEVKCWKDNYKALKKAGRQLVRLKKTLQSGIPIEYRNSGKKIDPLMGSFDSKTMLIPVSYNGSGFKFSLDESLDDLMILRERLINCQSRRACQKLVINSQM
jgi:hypothetical protein